MVWLFKSQKNDFGGIGNVQKGLLIGSYGCITGSPVVTPLITQAVVFPGDLNGYGCVNHSVMCPSEKLSRARHRPREPSLRDRSHNVKKPLNLNPDLPTRGVTLCNEMSVEIWF